MNLSPELQQEIEQIANSQGVSPEQFIIRTLVEKIESLKQPSTESVSSSTEAGHQRPQLRHESGILVIDTVPLSHINFNNLIDQLRTERDQEQLCW